MVDVQDTTLDAAPAVDAGQPDAQAVEPSSDVTGQPAGDAAAQDAQPAQADSPELILGKYKSQEDVIRALQEANGEALRLKAQLNAYERGVKDASQRPVQSQQPEQPKYNVDQLEAMKVQLSGLQAKAIQDGDIEKAQQYAGNLVWCDREIRKQELSQFQQQTLRQSAEDVLVQESVDLLRQHQAELVPGSPLYEKAAQYHAQYLRMGRPDNPVTHAECVTRALIALGRSQAAPAAAPKPSLNSSINAALKAGVKAGAGKSASTKPTLSADDIMNVPDHEWESFKRQRGWPV